MTKMKYLKVIFLVIIVLKNFANAYSIPPVAPGIGIKQPARKTQDEATIIGIKL